MLRRLNLRGVYKSDQADILQDFYIPSLSVAATYDRAVGFFSASTISYAAQALSALVQNGGKIRLILGAFSDKRDIDAANEGLRLRQISEIIGAEFLSQITNVDESLFQERFRALAWLIANGRMDIKIALRPKGMYHDKIGIITDNAGDSIVFSGSANESAQALVPTLNYESIDVYPTWKPELRDYFEPHTQSFVRLWENKSKGTAVLDLPAAARDHLLRVAETMDYTPDPAREAAILKMLLNQSEEPNRERAPSLPRSIAGNPFAIRDHQREALNAWRTKGEFVGILDLATGAGKTITAAYAVVQMAKQVSGLTVVVAVPYQNLADQWCDALEEFNIHAIRCYSSREQWIEPLSEATHEIEMGARNFQAIVVVNRTLQTAEFQSYLARIPSKRFLWIGDECHHHSSEAFAGLLPENADYRLGLSATPHHYLDEDRNERLRSYYGDVVYSYSLERAIADKILTPYEYFPRIVKLTEEEADEFIGLSNEISMQFARLREAGMKSSPANLTALLMKRARIIGSAANKLPALMAILRSRPQETHSLFYCGDGQLDPENALDEMDDIGTIEAGRQIEVVSRALDQLGWRVSRFTARESRRERADLLVNFKDGLIDALVAIRCLDEGIDVPACRTAYVLASSRDPRQFVQRRGRILRRSVGKELATIFDFVVVMPDNVTDSDGHARKLIRAELARVAEFSNLAANRHEVYSYLRPTLQAYDLEHLL